jgi:hypothetical protein
MGKEKQSSVEWLEEQFEVSHSYINEIFKETIKQAKAMHKEEVINSFGVGCHLESKRLVGYHDIAEQYYNETFGGNNESN